MSSRVLGLNLVPLTSCCEAATLLNRHPAFSALNLSSAYDCLSDLMCKWKKLSKGHQVPVMDPNLLEEVPKQVKAKKTFYLCMNDQDIQTFWLHEGDEVLVVLLRRKPVSAKQFIIRWQGSRDLWLGQGFSI